MSVDTLNREQLLKTCIGWDRSHTDLLLSELESRARGESIVGVELVRTGEKKLHYAAAMLGRYADCPCAATAIGLTLIN
jgi:hypothetical protein